MPNIESIPVPSYIDLSAYNAIVDNIPIFALAEQIQVINTQVDNNSAILAQSIGTQGSLANRLSQSINDDGSLKAEAIDDALHSIAEHLDTIDFVRMTMDERTKISFIADNATSLAIDISTISGVIPFINETLTLGGSDSIVWDYVGGRIVPQTNFPSSVRHNHYYGVVPVTGDYENYTTTMLSTAYKEGSLRVYVNGIRLNQDDTVYTPLNFPSMIYSTLKFTEGTATDGVVTGGDFALSDTISVSDNIIIDFDVVYS